VLSRWRALRWCLGDWGRMEDFLYSEVVGGTRRFGLGESRAEGYYGYISLDINAKYSKSDGFAIYRIQLFSPFSGLMLPHTALATSGEAWGCDSLEAELRTPMELNCAQLMTWLSESRLMRLLCKFSLPG
jgi:hypothetical protein